ncbi:hypothetical protein STEG23_015686 [Scotinomys teguina]
MPRPDHCNVDKAEENYLKTCLTRMLEEAFEEKVKKGEDPIWVPRRLTRILKDTFMDDDVPAEPADVLDEPTDGEDGAKMGDPVSVSEFDASPA